MGILLSILITSISLLIVSQFLPGIKVKNFETALVVSVVYGVLSALLFKLLVLLTLPITLLTFGLFIFVINAFLLWLTDKLVEDFELEGFGSALVGSLGLSVVSTLLRWLLF